MAKVRLEDGTVYDDEVVKDPLNELYRPVTLQDLMPQKRQKPKRTVKQYGRGVFVTTGRRK